jgi:hypothetical protein
MTKCDRYLVLQAEPAAEHAGGFTMDRHRRRHTLFRIWDVGVGNAISDIAHHIRADRRGQANLIARQPRRVGGVCGAAQIAQQRHIEHFRDLLIWQSQTAGQMYRERTCLNGVTTRLTHS